MMTDGPGLESMIGKIRMRLLSRRDVLCEEITTYPTPITACDVHFNRLLEERDRTFLELQTLDKLTAGVTSAALLAFVRESRALDPGDRSIFERVLAGQA